MREAEKLQHESRVLWASRTQTLETRTDLAGARRGPLVGRDPEGAAQQIAEGPVGQRPPVRRTMNLGDRHALGPPAIDGILAQAALADAGDTDHADHLTVPRQGPTQGRLQAGDLVRTTDEAREAARPRGLDAAADAARAHEGEAANRLAHALDADLADGLECEEVGHQGGRVCRQVDASGGGALLHASREADGMTLRGVVHAQVVADRPDDHPPEFSPMRTPKRSLRVRRSSCAKGRSCSHTSSAAWHARCAWSSCAIGAPKSAMTPSPVNCDRSEAGAVEALQRGSASTARWRSQWSASTRQTMASTIGTARGSTQGSWRPPAARRAAWPSRSTVSCCAADGGGGLEGDAQHDALAVADAALDAAGAVGGGARPAVRAPARRRRCARCRSARAGEAAADLEALRRGQREQALREVGLELVEHRLAEPGRHAARHALDHAAERVAAPRARRRWPPPCARRPRGPGSAPGSPRSARASRSPGRPSTRWRGRARPRRAPRVRDRARGASARSAPAATRPIVSRALARPPPCQLRTPYFASLV